MLSITIRDLCFSVILYRFNVTPIIALSLSQILKFLINIPIFTLLNFLISSNSLIMFEK